MVKHRNINGISMDKKQRKRMKLLSFIFIFSVVVDAVVVFIHVRLLNIHHFWMVSLILNYMFAVCLCYMLFLLIIYADIWIVFTIYSDHVHFTYLYNKCYSLCIHMCHLPKKKKEKKTFYFEQKFINEYENRGKIERNMINDL